MANTNVPTSAPADQIEQATSLELEAALYDASDALDRAHALAEIILAKFEELLEISGGDLEGDGAEQILAREILDGLRQLCEGGQRNG